MSPARQLEVRSSATRVANRQLRWFFEDHVALIYATEHRLETCSNIHALDVLSLRQAAIDQQRTAVGHAVCTFKWEQTKSLWKPIKSKACPTNKTILLKRIIAH